MPEFMRYKIGFVVDIKHPLHPDLDGDLWDIMREITKRVDSVEQVYETTLVSHKDMRLRIYSPEDIE